LAFILTEIDHTGSTTSLGAAGGGRAILLDFGVQGNVVLGYRALFMPGAETAAASTGFI
jgi:hypothetical protein